MNLKDANEQENTSVYINFDTVPFIADLVFPQGIPRGGYVSLICGTFDDGVAKQKRPSEKIDELVRSLGKRFRLQSPIVEGVPQCFLRISLQHGVPDVCSGKVEETEQKRNDGEVTPKRPMRSKDSEEDPKEDDSLSSRSGSDSQRGNDDLSVSDDSEEKEYLCSKCPASFESAEERRAHTTTAHEALHGCPFCQRKFVDKYALVRHMWSHLPSSMMPFKCKDCQVPFLSRKELLAHKADPEKCCPEGSGAPVASPKEGQLSNQEVYMCEFCSDVFLTNRGYAQHLSKCHREEAARKPKEQLCSFCETYVASDYKDLCAHLSQKHPEAKMFPCQKCSRTFEDKSGAETHEKTHFVAISFSKESPSGKIYQCSLCEETLTTLGTLLSHVRRHNGGQSATRHVCDVCYKRFQSGYRLKRHMRKQHLPQSEKDAALSCKCFMCMKMFGNHALLKRHTRSVHERCLPYVCRQCPKKFPTERQLQSHLAISHRSEMSEEALKRLNLIKKFLCQECGFSTYSDKTIRRHVYAHSGSYPHECDECGRGFVFRFELTSHRSRHHRQERYTCERCPRVFYSHDRFEQHVSAHDGGWGLECASCGQLYETRGYLESHQLVHSEHTPYVCNVCGKRFKTPQSLTFHNVGHHGSRSFVRNAELWPYRCYVCNISFKYMSSLHAHNACLHVAEEERLECQYCSKKFRSKVTLSQHIRTHTRESAGHRCGQCKKSFASYSVLKRHVIHSHGTRQRTSVQQGDFMRCMRGRPRAEEEEEPQSGDELPQVEEIVLD